jgi:internalin A
MSAIQPARLKALKPEASRIFKLCLDKDKHTALQGLELASALGQPLEGVLDEVSLDPGTNELVRGKRFTGNDKTQPMLDALLILQLGLAPQGTPAFKVRKSIQKLSCIAAVIPNLEGFTSLEELELKLPSEFQGQDLKALGRMPKLKKLEFGTYTVSYGTASGQIESLNGLDTPALEEISATYKNLNDVSALSQCKKLKRVDLKGNINLTTIECLKPSVGGLEVLNLNFCRGITTLAPLREATSLAELYIQGLNLITDLSDLKKLKALQKLNFRGCEGLQSLTGIPMSALSNPDDDPEDEPNNFLNLASMKSLTSLDHLPPLSSHVTAFLVTKALALIDINGLKASASSIKDLKINEAQITNLETLASLEHLEELEITSCPKLVDASALGELKKLRKVTLKNCNKLEKMPDAWLSPVTFLSLPGCPSLKPLKALPPGINTKTIEIGDRRLLPRAKPIKALKSDVGAVWKLLSSRDVANIQMGLELSSAVEEGFDTLYEGVIVKDGKLEQGKRFTGTGPAQPYLDIALFGLMSQAKPGSKLANLKEQITELNLVLASISPKLVGFSRLETLSITPLDDITPDLSNFGPLPELKTLKITGRRWSFPGGLTSLRGLQAPKLMNVDLSHIKLEDLSALSHSSEITTLSLEGNASLKELDGLHACAPNLVELNLKECKHVQNLNALSKAINLKKLDLYECESLTSVMPLASCKSLETLTLEGCKKLVSLEGLELSHIKCQADYRENYEFCLDNCSSLSSLEHFPPIGETITRLSLVNTSSLKSLKGLKSLHKLKEIDASGSGLQDLTQIEVLPNLIHVSLRQCKDLKNAEPLGALNHIQKVDMSGSGVQLMPKTWAGPVREIDLSNCDSLKSFVKLPETLQALVCDYSNDLVKLDGMEGCLSLEKISAKGCKSLSNLGILPSVLKNIIVLGCDQLQSLKGLESCKALEVVSVPLSIKDASGLAGHEEITLAINVHEVIDDKNKNKTLATLPQTFISAVNELKSINLQVRGPSGIWSSESSFDLSGFNKFKNLRTLSFLEYDFSCAVSALVWLVQIPDLQSVWFYPRGSMSHRLGSSIYDTPNKVRALQLRICQEAKVAPPAHLAE